MSLRVWLATPGDLDMLYTPEGKPTLYTTSIDLDMTDQGWIDLGNYTLLITPPARDPLVSTVVKALQAQLKTFDKETAKARAILLSRISNLLALPFNPSTSDPQGVDMAPDEGTAL